jgi:hypothetical protein
MKMAQRRMFSIALMNSSKFLKMPSETQNLYFHLGLRADDDGIVEAFSVMRVVGANEDNIKLLHSKGFIRVLNDELVTYITDWHEHNCIRADRKVDSIYKNLLIEIIPEVKLIEPVERADRKKEQIEDNHGTSQGQPMDNHGTDNGRHRLGKDRLGKDKIKKDNSAFYLTFESLWNDYPNKLGKASVNLKKLEIVVEKYGLEQIKRCIKRYKAQKPAWKEYQHGSTFFNSGYIDYLDSATNSSSSTTATPFKRTDVIEDNRIPTRRDDY